MTSLGDENPAPIELRPLSARIADHDGERSVNETVSLINDKIHSQDHNERSPKDTGLLIRDTALPTPANDPKGVRRNGHSNAFAVWSLELVSLLLAFGFMGAMIAILQTYDNNEMPNWNGGGSGGITLNALIGVLATIFRAILAFVALEVLAQLKWEWLTARFRPLNHVQRFEDATRGTWGPIMLLPIVKIRQPLSVIAVVVVVLSVAIGPFSQQAVQTYYCLRIAEERPATVQVAHRIDSMDESPLFYQRSGISGLKVSLQSAMQDALANPSTDSNIPSMFKCRTGNCTFSTHADHPEQPEEERASYASLAMCSRCEDVYDLVRTEVVEQTEAHRGQIFVRLPVSGLDEEIPYYDITNSSTKLLQVSPGSRGDQDVSCLDAAAVGNLAWASGILPQDFLDVARWSAANFSILALSQDRCGTLADGKVSCPLPTGNIRKIWRTAWGEPTDYVAAACTLYPCIKYYTSKVQNGALFETVVRSTPLHGVEGYYALTQYGVQVPCWVNGTLYTSSNISSAADKLHPSAKQDVVINLQYWPHESPDARVGYTNMTAPRDCVMAVNSNFIRAIQTELIRTFRVVCWPNTRWSDDVTCRNYEGGDSISMASLLRPRVTSLNTIRENIDSLSMRITTQIRRSGQGPYMKDQVPAQGEAWENRTCLHVAWEWFALPATLLVLCTLLIAGIITRDLRANRNSLVWKGSVLPFLLKDHVKGLEMSNLKTLNVAAKDFEIKLQKAD
ncbi:unnamed protein product [Clonostachys rosea]|uniref:Carboxylic ester hydrolase n=1 Tax=Bionectria ochroleuca TaxID=29856 RepID=A0ABY6V061_BIOOC|nr:unnamed protein product [Clonostachys rosea]